MGEYLRKNLAIVRAWPRAFREQVMAEEAYLSGDEKLDLERRVSHEESKLLDAQTRVDFRLWVLSYYIRDWYVELVEWRKQREEAKKPEDIQRLNETLRRMYALDPEGGKIRFVEALGVPSQMVFRGRYEESKANESKDVVIKWTADGITKIDTELDRLKRLKAAGAQLPWFRADVMFWNQRILVMEFLQPLDASDDPYTVGKAVLRTLATIHRIGMGCYSDLKPENVMKRGQQYFLIDYGGMSTERRFFGWERKAWTSGWAFQVEEAGQITTPKYDLLEWCGMMKGVRALRPETVREMKAFDDTLEHYVHTFGTAEPLYPVIEEIRRHSEDRLPADIYETLEKRLDELGSPPLPTKHSERLVLVGN